MIGVTIRYYLAVLFGSNELDFFSSDNILFSDLGSNFLGSFIIGITGIGLKQKILNVSESVLIGINTGLCGSITTYSS